MPQNRQLAAIMFTDIVGYTALMGEDEQKAFDVLKKNREIHQPIIDKFKGKLIKELGDGILASFPTVSEALSAAIKIQQACLVSKKLSLRIGIHEGEIIIENNDIYGDSVNIASRIQTLGIPGSILFSKKVADEIKNQAEFHTVSLGSFEFKNVNDSIEVFALANDGFPVPKRSMMEGKLKKKNFQKRKVIVSLSFILLAVAVFIIYKKFFEKNTHAEIDKSIAVLPFVDMSAGKDQEYFSDGLSEELLNLLSKISELKVIGRTSSFSFKGKNEDLRIIGEKLGVDHILGGSVQKDVNQIRVTAQLIRTADGRNLWSDKYDRDLDSIFKLQDEIAGAVVKQLKLKLLPPMAKTGAASINTESYNLMLQGNYLAEKRDKVNTAKAIDLYLQALAIDSLDHRLWAALAHGLSIQASWGWINAHEGYEKVRNAATKSIYLEENQAEAYKIIGDMKIYYEWDWEGAKNNFNKALNLKPNDPDLLRSMGSLARSLGRLDESFRWLKKSLDLDPLKPITYFHLGFQQIYAAHFEEAIVTYKKILELSPQFPGAHTYLGEVYLLQGKPDKALTEIQQELSKRRKGFGLALAYKALQRQKEAEEALRDYIAEFHGTDMYMIAEIYAFFGEKNKAFEWLEKAYAGRDVRFPWMKGDPLLKNLYTDPRYNAFLKKMNLPLD